MLSSDITLPSLENYQYFKCACPALTNSVPVVLKRIALTGLESLFTVNFTPCYQSQTNSPLSGSEPKETK
jgi:hypothetical protein